MSENWIEVCNVGEIEKEDVLRFDLDDRTFAVYRTAEDTYHATDGFCTHANVHLSGGFVMDHIIECPKHNGRFDFTTGQAKGAPACVDLKIYPVKVEEGKVFLNAD